MFLLKTKSFCRGTLILIATLSLEPFGNLPAQAEEAGRAVNVVGRVLVRNERTKAEKRELKPGDSVVSGDVLNTASNSTVKLLMSDRTIVDLSGSTLFKIDEYKLKNGDNREVMLSMDYGKIRGSVNRPVGPTGKFILRTKSATMGVRGTEFLVTTDFNHSANTPKESTPPSEGGPGKPGTSGAPQGQTPDVASPGKSAGPKANLAEVKTEITVISGKVAVTDLTKGEKKPIEVSAGKQLTTIAQISGDTVLKAAAKAEPPKLIELNPVQMKAVIKDVKLDDSTFRQAVVLDTKNGQSSGADTLSALSSYISNAPTHVPGAGELNTPGTFKPNPNMLPPMILPAGMPVNLQVVFYP